MKTLDQVEPRIPGPASGEIDAPGSYYLTGNAADDIYLNASNVTLNLAGFSANDLKIWVGSGIENIHPERISGKCRHKR